MDETKRGDLPPFDIRPGERYTDAEGKVWELTDHGQWEEYPMADPHALSRTPANSKPFRDEITSLRAVLTQIREAAHMRVDPEWIIQRCDEALARSAPPTAPC